MNINQDGNPLNHNEDLIEQQEIQTLGLPFEDSECEEDFLNKAAVIIHKRFETEERSCDYKEHGENSDKSTLEGHQETHTWKNHSKVSMRSQPYLKHQRVNVEEKTHESSENENNFSKMSQPHRTHTEEKTFECSQCKKYFHQESCLPH